MLQQPGLAGKPKRPTRKCASGVRVRQEKKLPQRREPVFAGPGPRRKADAGKAGKKSRRRKPLIFRVMSWGMMLGLWAMIAVFATTGYLFVNLDKQGLFNIPEREPGIMLLAADGSVLAERGAFFGDAVRIDELPPYVPQAIIAIEDRRFYSHFGVDPIGIARALYANWRARATVQGGSTITQQLAKNLFLKPERTLERKMQEAVLAIWLESKYSKDEILQLYVNRVYFGAGATGIDKAAQRFFGKSARDVNLSEAAVLAAVLKAPSRYNPIASTKRANERAREVLNDMVKAGFITQAEADATRGVQARAPGSTYIPAKRYVVNWVNETLPDLIGELKDSVVVETTIDPQLQESSEKALRAELAKNGKKLKAEQAAMVVMDTTGAVRAMIGGRSYIKSQFNRAVKAKRQPGSSFKPFVYLAAIDAGMTPNTVKIDEPVTYGDWSPDNYKKKHLGPVKLTTALAKSINTVAAKVAMEVGPENVAATARRLGIASPLVNNASIALGTSEVSLLEMTAAYVPFANGGSGVLPHVITRITTRDGKVLYERSGGGPGQVISFESLGAMNYMMRQVVEDGTGRAAAIEGHETAGKTGTSQDYRDAWFIGYTSHLVAGVWVGNDNNSPTNNVTGGSMPARIFAAVMRPAHANRDAVPLPGYFEPDEPAIAYAPAPEEQRNDGGGFVDSLRNIFGSREPEPVVVEPQPRQQQRPAKSFSQRQREQMMQTR
jgi:penicillin-binding protein 1A